MNKLLLADQVAYNTISFWMDLLVPQITKAAEQGFFSVVIQTPWVTSLEICRRQLPEKVIAKLNDFGYTVRDEITSDGKYRISWE